MTDPVKKVRMDANVTDGHERGVFTLVKGGREDTGEEGGREDR